MSYSSKSISMFEFDVKIMNPNHCNELEAHLNIQPDVFNLRRLDQVSLRFLSRERRKYTQYLKDFEGAKVSQRLAELKAKARQSTPESGHRDNLV